MFRLILSLGHSHRLAVRIYLTELLRGHSRVVRLSPDFIFGDSPHVHEVALLSQIRGPNADDAGLLIPLQDQLPEDRELIPDLMHVSHGPPEKVDQLLVIRLTQVHIMLQGRVEPVQWY